MHGIDENKLRLDGAKHIDLWAKGELFPIDPKTNLHPDFKSITGLVKFLCHGKQGLLGYCESLKGNYTEVIERNNYLEMRNNHLEMRNNHLEMIHYHLAGTINQLQSNNMTLINENSSLKKITSEQSRDINEKREEIIRLLAEKCHLTEEVMNIKTKLDDITKKWNKVKATPLGGRVRVKCISDVSSLSHNGGAWKRRVYAMKYLMDPKKVEKNNGDLDVDMSSMIKSMFKKKEIISMIKKPCFNSLRQSLVDELISQISKSVNVDEIQNVCDDTGISRRAYETLFKCLREGMMNAGITKIVIPRPFHIKISRGRKNENIVNILGDMYHVQASKEFGKKVGKKGSHSELITLNPKNNVWVDLEKTLQAMVKFYDISIEEAHGKLVFVIKLDEMELINAEKYERVSITLMNRAMDKNINNTDKKYFSVQSEDHIWWLGLFRIDKESHDSLKWVFHQTSIPTTIASYNMGEKLYVEGYGSYEVEWHLAVDLKTLKCMYNIGHGANAKHSCIYCMHTRKKEKSPSGGWSNGIMSCRQDMPPNRENLDKNIDHILPIPLTRVHICTLHAFVRIIDKLVYLSILSAWNRSPKESAQKSIEEIEKVLSNAGLHGGNVKICKDIKLSGARGNVPCKPSMGGVKACHFIEDSKERLEGQQKLFGELIDAEND